MANLFLMDYKNNKWDTGILEDEVKRIDIQVISGDEVADVYFGNAVHRIDVSELNKIPRLYDYFDMGYSIDGNQISEWNRRKDTYDWPLWEEEE